ncbi:MAG: DUF2909 family protein [Pseudomonadota bacterium]|nr:DUF2909 family protein [Pseudomonadota bacterium]
MHILIAAAFVAILGALALAGVFMLRGGGERGSRSGSMMRALALRIAVSVLLFLAILAAWALGWIHPGGLPVGR